MENRMENTIVNEEAFRPSFYAARNYLNQAKDEKRRMELLRQRIDLRRNDPDGSEFLDTGKLEKELKDSKQTFNDACIDVTDLAAQLPDVSQQMVVTKRYVDMESWEQIAEEMGSTVRTVQKLHGKALPRLEEIVRKNGLTRGMNIVEEQMWR